MNDASTIDAEDDQDTVTPKVEAKPEAAPSDRKLPNPAPKTQVVAQDAVMALIPRSLDEAWKMADAFYVAGMVPKSLEGKGEKETKAKVMLAICKGAELGFGPVTAVSTIMVINAKACLYGDGASSLVQNSGKVEWIKTTIASKDDSGKWGEGYKVTVSLKRKDQEEPYVRSFSFEDAKRARLTGKQGPWTDYPERQCYWRAWSWAARDGASDALMGLAVAEEVRDYEIEAQRTHKTDTSDLDDTAKPPEPKAA
jgi:hypothetical protein